jgi:amino acid transporter
MAKPDGFVKGLGLLDATTLVMGSMIGSGIFIVSADVARQVKSPGLLMVCWGVAAALTMIAALSYGELAAAMPQAGGQYVYLREAFGRLWGFLFGWTTFVVIQTGTIAAVAVAFAKYTGIFMPSVSGSNYLVGSGKIGLTTQQLLAIAIVIVLTWGGIRRLWRLIFTISGAALRSTGQPWRWWGQQWWGRCFRPTRGTISRSRPAKCGIRSAICRFRSDWGWA